MDKFKKLIVKRKNDELEAEPDVMDDALVFHPVPKTLLVNVKEGDIWEGRLGRLWDANKTDKNGKKVFIRYFIPETLITGGKSE